MLRLLIVTLIVVGLAAFGAMELAKLSGEFVLTIENWRIEAAAGVAVGLLIVALALAVVLVEIMRMIWKAPQRIGENSRANRERKGLAYLQEAFILEAKGDKERATRAANRAITQLDNKVLPQLITARMALDSGDERRAERALTALAENDETKVIGLTGLAELAQKAGDQLRLIALAEQTLAIDKEQAWALEVIERKTVAPAAEQSVQAAE